MTETRTVLRRRREASQGSQRAAAGVGEGVVQAPAEAVPKVGTTRPALAGSLVIGMVTFVVILGGICAAFIFLVRKPATESRQVGMVEASAKGPLVYHTLIERYVFATTLPPLGDRSVTFEFAVAVQAHKADMKVLEEIIARGELMPKLQADIRRIISQEEYTKLRAQDLANVAREIRETLNADLGQDLVTDVVFPVWNVW